jgi:hypothetical protein
VLQHIAQWNPTTQLWETDQIDLFSGLSEPFSETFPTSGMTQGGRLLPLPALGHPIGGSECSSLRLLPTVRAAQGETRNSNVYHRYDSEGNLMYNNLENALGAMPSVAAMLPTPRATDATKGGPNQRGSSGDLMLLSAVMNLE